MLLSRTGTTRATIALFAAFAPSCAEPAPTRPSPSPVLIPAATSTAPLECRFEPVTRVNARAESGLEQCFSSGAPDPWWMRYRAEAEAEAEAVPPLPVESDAQAPPLPCPPEMVLVDGMYCPEVRQRCLRYLDEGDEFLSRHRCAEFDPKPECTSSREHRRFCIDRDEYVAPGTELPLGGQSWTMAKELCESLGKRLCFESEWQFACEGEALLGYPYGFKRDAKLCNHDLADLEHRGKLRDLRVKPEARPGCLSPFGVRNMVGNVDEWTFRDLGYTPWRAALRGGWWLAGRNNCRAATTGHDEFYFGPQTGMRCCKSSR